MNSMAAVMLGEATIILPRGGGGADWGVGDGDGTTIRMGFGGTGGGRLLRSVVVSCLREENKFMLSFEVLEDEGIAEVEAEGA